MKTKFIAASVAAVLCVVGLCQVGCGGPKKPADLPKLFSCIATVTQEGTPLADATVLFFPEDPALQKWSISGKTDASGKVILMTHNFKGVPAGNYVVTINKTEMTESEVVEVNGEKMMTPGKNFYLVEEQFMESEKSPLKHTQDAKASTPEFDAGKKVRVEVTKAMELSV